jgi:hypothetical protein
VLGFGNRGESRTDVVPLCMEVNVTRKIHIDSRITGMAAVKVGIRTVMGL